ncbi:pentatricopeptide repeat-containing protein At4g21065-like [Miscanthus floridulus]|uniref:pentatricopeptide repeat-containing protein At4g21065-like n=1 Tax=Miscanthus floridulus TaxID=154761 RepID=UPI003457A736
MPFVTYRYQALKESLAAAITSSPHAADPRRPHALAVVSGLAANGYLASLLVARYARLGDPDAARGVFDAAATAASSSSSSSPSATPPKPLLYNAMLRGYLALGLPREAAALLRAMLASGSCAPDRHTYHLAATACAFAPDLDLGRRGVRARGVRPPGGHRAHQDARRGRGHGRRAQGRLAEAVEMFGMMRSVDGARPTEPTLVSLVSGYAGFGSWKGRGMMHAAVIKSGFQHSLFVSNALLEMYAELGCLGEALLVFRQMKVKDSVTWSSMIGGLVRNSKPEYAVKLFHWMLLSICRDIQSYGSVHTVASESITCFGVSRYQADVLCDCTKHCKKL